MKVARICETCGITFFVHSSDLKYGRGRYCSNKCYIRTGSKNPKWRGGKVETGGYIYIYKPKHPNATLAGYICEHRYVMEQKLGRVLDRDEIVHHINGAKTDNRVENLVVVTRAKHMTIHHKGIKQTSKHIQNRFANRRPHDMSKYSRDSSGRFIKQ